MYSLFLLPIILEILDVNIVVLFHNRGFRGPGNPPPRRGGSQSLKNPKDFFYKWKYWNTVILLNFLTLIIYFI